MFLKHGETQICAQGCKSPKTGFMLSNVTITHREPPFAAVPLCVFFRESALCLLKGMCASGEHPVP